jgi:hypothetical protein
MAFRTTYDKLNKPRRSSTTSPRCSPARRTRSNGSGSWAETKIDGYRPSDEAGNPFNPVTPIPPKKYEELEAALRVYDRPNEYVGWSPGTKIRKYDPFAKIAKQDTAVDLTEDQMLAFHPIFKPAGATDTGVTMRGDDKLHGDLWGPMFASKATMADWISANGEPHEKKGDIAIYERVMAARDPEWRPFAVAHTIHVLPTEFGTVTVHGVTKTEGARFTDGV